MITATSSYLRFVHGWDAQSALFGASPGALAQVMTLAAEYKADLRAIAIVQTMRVVALTMGIPAGLSFFGLTVEGGGSWRASSRPVPRRSRSLPSWSPCPPSRRWCFSVAVPGGLMFGAMLASAILHGTGFIHSTLPWWVVFAAVIGIGAVTGSRFANTDPWTLLRFLGAALGSFAVAMTVAALSVLVLTMLMSVRIADAVVAFAPGAQDTMMVLALALHLDPVFVGALQLSRFLLVSMLVPFLATGSRRGGQTSRCASARRARRDRGRRHQDGSDAIPPPAGVASAAGRVPARPRPVPRPACRSGRRRGTATARCAAARCPSARSDS